MKAPSKEQQIAIEHIDGPALLIAGPGSGKTFTITARLLHLINDINVTPESILVLTFSKSAAQEMQNRFLLSSDSYGVLFGTFHSLAFNILKNDFGFSNTLLITQNEKRRMLSQVFKNKGMSSLCTYDFLNEILDKISRSKNSANYEEIAFNIVSPDITNEMLNKIIDEYLTMLEDYGKIDFDDMILKCLQKLRNNPDKLHNIQNRYKYILIDEFQDINKPQYDLVTLLAKPQNNLFVVGDDDQAIYRFRGSTPGIMNTFKEHYPNAKTLMLMDNYRSGQTIIDLAGKVIEKNHVRISKDFHPINKGGTISYHTLSSRVLEENKILEILKSIDDYESTAIIVRTNMEVALYSTLLKNNNISIHENKSNKSSVFDSFILDDLLSFLKFLYENHSREYFLKFMNKPNKFIQRICLKSETVYENDLLSYYSQNKEMLDTITGFFKKLALAEKLKPHMAVSLFRKSIGYDKYLHDISINPTQYKEYLATANELEAVFYNYHKECSLQEFIDNSCSKDENKSSSCTSLIEGVNVITMHTAKGLEFENVILPDVNDGIIPSKQSVGDALEEERRLLYVAITRAKSNLFILVNTERNRTVSRFIKGLIKETN